MRYSDTPRQSVVAGRFYPGNADELKKQVTACLAARPSRVFDFTNREVLAVMAPHAGYVFSGAVAGMTLNQVPLPERIIALGPNHTGCGALFSLWSGGPWRTPLGVVPVDKISREALAGAHAGFTPDTAAHEQEHSLEVLLPFFQVLRPAARVLPIIVGGGAPDELRDAGEALAAVVLAAKERGGRVLLVVSSDMSHYLPHEKTVERDTLALEALASLDAETFYNTVRGNNISMCGVFPMTMALFALAKLGATRADVVVHATSGQTGRAFGAGMDKVVGYAGVIFS